MPARGFVAKELGALLGVLSHPHRIRIVTEIRDRELDVNALQAALNIAHSAVSQHLSVMRSHRLVSERREGRHVYYRLQQPELATWLLDGLKFLEAGAHQAEEIREAVEHTRSLWSR